MKKLLLLFFTQINFTMDTNLVNKVHKESFKRDIKFLSNKEEKDLDYAKTEKIKIEEPKCIHETFNGSCLRGYIYKNLAKSEFASLFFKNPDGERDEMIGNLTSFYLLKNYLRADENSGINRFISVANDFKKMKKEAPNLFAYLNKFERFGKKRKKTIKEELDFRLLANAFAEMNNPFNY